MNIPVEPMIAYMTEEDYTKLLISGRLWTLYPTATGDYLRDVMERDYVPTRTRLGNTAGGGHTGSVQFLKPPLKGCTPRYYNKTYKGVKLDPYRIAKIYGITNHAQFQALKKLLRAGADHKDFKQDLTEARDALNREIEMLEEDES